MEKCKRFLFGFLILGVIFLPRIASADLTKQDCEEIRKIVREEIQIEIKGVQAEIRGVQTEIRYVNQRIDDLTGLIYVILAGMFALVGFVLWDRRTALAPAIRKVEVLEEREKKVETILKEYAVKEPKMAGVLRKIEFM